MSGIRLMRPSGKERLLKKVQNFGAPRFCSFAANQTRREGSKQKGPQRGPLFPSIISERSGLDPHAKFGGLRFAGIRIEIVGCAPFESIAATQFGANKNAQCSDSQL